MIIPLMDGIFAGLIVGNIIVAEYHDRFRQSVQETGMSAEVLLTGIGVPS